MEHEYIARGLSRAKREMLIEHVNGPRPVERNPGTFVTRQWLMQRGLLHGSTVDGTTTFSERPTHTAITYDGRGVVAWVLAEYADALVRCGSLEAEVIGPSLAPAINSALTILMQRRGYGPITAPARAEA